jgi:methyl-accepting chemotaxis protein
MKIGTKLFLAAAALTVIPVTLTAALVGQGTYSIAGKELENAAREQLVSVRESRKQAIADYLEGSARAVQVMARSSIATEAMSGFKRTFYSSAKEKDEAGRPKAESMTKYREALKAYYDGDFVGEFKKRNPGNAPQMSGNLDRVSEHTLVHQYDYIINNPNPLGEKNKMPQAKDGSAYGKQHAISHPQLEAFRDKFGFYDVFLVDIETDTVIYTAFKELDYSSNLETGIASKSGLADAYRKVKKAKTPDDIGLTDYAPYLVSYNDQAAFMGVPIFDNNVQTGVFLVQLPLDKITAVMTANKSWKSVGLGGSGETYLIGRDGLMRSDSRFIIEDKAGFLKTITALTTEQRQIAEKKNTTIGILKIDTPAAQAALRGDSGFQQIADYRNTPVLSAYTPFKTLGLDWALLAEIDVAEALAARAELARSSVIRGALVGFAFLALAGLAAFLFVRNFLKPVNQLSSAVRRIASGDIEARARVKSGDEMEDLGKAFDNLLDERIAIMAKAERENEQLNNSAVNVLQAVFRLSQKDLTARAPVSADVVGTVADSVNQLAEATSRVLGEVTTVAGEVATQSREVKRQSEAVHVTAAEERVSVEQMNLELQSAADMMRRVAELADHSNSAAADASRATESALATVNGTVRGMDAIRETIAETEKRIKRLGERSQEIGQIVGLINTIAERTHVLSLNAAMQAAVAGDAGRGFAVVAEEVQRLAESARQATSQIGQLIHNIQIETNETVTTVNRTIAQVVSGSEMAEQSGERMRSTQENTKRLVETVARIAEASRAQLAVADDLRRRADDIAASTKRTAQQLETQNAVTDSMLEQSRRLIESVSVFKLAA